MYPARSSQIPPEADLHRTRRTFLFAREQLTTQTSGYLAARDARRRRSPRERGARPGTDAPSAPRV